MKILSPIDLSSWLFGIRDSAAAAVSDVIDFVYPPECAVCERPLELGHLWFCPACRDLAADVLSPLCPNCRSAIPQGKKRCTCEACEGDIDLLYCCGEFDTFYRAIVHSIKYDRMEPLASIMADTLAERILSFTDFPPFQLVVPVPLHWTRLRERGFNQSALLADELSARIGVGVSRGVLKRRKRTRDQTGLSAEQRRENVRGAFGLRNVSEIRGKAVLLVDDVTTTGATLAEAASQLRKGGCSKVSAAVIAVTDTVI